MEDKFKEEDLERAMMELFRNEEYIHKTGVEIHKEISDVLLRYDLRTYLADRYAEQEITHNEIAGIIRELETGDNSLYENNKRAFRMVAEGFPFKREDPTKKDLFIEFIDFTNPENNLFKIVNQLLIKGKQETRIPDGIVYINGIPLVVLEFKSAIKENTSIMDAYNQLTIRYRRDIPELFKYNAFVVISDGVNNRFGSLFTPYEFFYSWNKVESTDETKEGINTLYTMVKGLFRKKRLLEVIHDFIYFPDQSKNELKVVCRYPQYFAATKLFHNIQLHSKMNMDGDGKGGTYFGTTGCGKSYTMTFLTRMLMKSRSFNNPTIVLITDRTDLDDQLSEQFVDSKKFIGDDCVMSVESREKLRELLCDRASGGVFLTTIQKFSEDARLLSNRKNIICISDEAHRSQINLEQKEIVTEKGVKSVIGFARFLHESLPNATYVGFTGTPIDATLDVFGPVVDAYTMTESVYDEITRRIVYEGRAAKIMLSYAKLHNIEKYYKLCEEKGANEYQVQSSKKAVTRMEEILKDPDRIKTIAEDFITHYEKRVSEGATVKGKAMFVCESRVIAWELYKNIIALRPEWAEKKLAEEGVTLTDKDKKELKELEQVKLVMTRDQVKDKNSEKELYDLLGSKEDRKELDRQFKNEKSNFKIAIVVDMWLTGFDIPCLDTMYIDKPLQKHTLIQTISRVNRVYEGKDMGLIVDYYGFKSDMNDAIKKYTGGIGGSSVELIAESVKLVKDELDILNRMFHKFSKKEYFGESPLNKLECLNKAAEFIQKTKEQETLFMGHAKKMKSAYNLCVNSEEITNEERVIIYFYVAIRSIIYKLTTGDAPDIDKMNKRVMEMIHEALQSNGVEEVIKIGQNKDNQQEIDLFSKEYLDKISKLKLPNTKIKLLELLLKQVISQYKKINKIKGVDFSLRMQKLVDKYNERKDNTVFADDVLTEVASQMADLLHEINKERQSFKDLGIDFEEKAFYDILKAVSVTFNFEYPEDKFITLSQEIKKIVADKSKYTDWSQRDDIKAELKVDLILILAKYGYPPVTNDEVFKEIFEQAENFKKYN